MRITPKDGVRKAEIRKVVTALVGRAGVFRINREGIYWQGKNLVSDPSLSPLFSLVERNLRNFVLPEPQSRQVLMEIFSNVISQPEVAYRSLSRVGAIFNLPEEIINKASPFTFIKPQEGALFLAKEGVVYTLEQIENGEVPGLGEGVVEFMQNHGLNRLVIAEGKIVPPYFEIGLGGLIRADGIGMSRMQTVNWATAVVQLDREKCTGCFQCLIVCPEGSIQVDEQSEGKRPKIKIDLTNCKGCGLCVGECPPKISAITMIGITSPVGKELIENILGKKRG